MRQRADTKSSQIALILETSQKLKRITLYLNHKSQDYRDLSRTKTPGKSRSMYAGFAKKTQNMADSLLEKALILDGFAHSLTILRATRQISEALSVCDAVRTELEETRIDWDELRTPVFAAPDAATHEPRPIFTGIRSGAASGCTRRHREGAPGRAEVSLLAQ